MERKIVAIQCFEADNW